MFTQKHHLSKRLKKYHKSLTVFLNNTKREGVLRLKNFSFSSKLIARLFDHNKIKKVLGTNLAVITLATNLLPGTSGISPEDIKNHIQVPIVLTTEKSVQLPVSELRVTQSFKFYHPGIDIDGTTGDLVKAIMAGKVVEAGRSKIGYGNYVLVDHQNGYKSLYAHLSKIEVKIDQEVDLNTEIGKMGSTGRSTGDHLHLEVYEEEKRINPLSILPLVKEGNNLANSKLVTVNSSN